MGVVKDPTTTKSPITDSQIQDLMIRNRLSRAEAEYVAESVRPYRDEDNVLQAGITEAEAVAEAKKGRSVADPRTGLSYKFPVDEAYEITDPDGRYIPRPGAMAPPIELAVGRELYGLKLGTYIRRGPEGVQGDVVGHDNVYVVNANGTVTRKGIMIGGEGAGPVYPPSTFTPTAP